MAYLDYNEVITLRTELLKLWNAAHGNWREWESFYEQKHQIRYVKPAEPRKLGVARSKINSMVDTLVTRKPDVKRHPVSQSQGSKDKADKVEKWATALLRKAVLGGSNGIPPFRTAAVYLGLCGYTAGVARWDDSIWEPKDAVKRGPGYKKRLEQWKANRKRAFPFIIEFPHPARILLPPMEKRPSMAIETATMYGWQVKGLLEQESVEGEAKLRASSYDILEVVQYWDEDARQLFIGGKLAEEKENGLGLVPYSHGFAGRGFEHMPTYGIGSSATSSGTTGLGAMGPSAEDMAVGLLAGYTDSIRYLDEFNTAERFLALRAAYPTLYTKEDSDELRRALETAGLGGIVTVADPAGGQKFEDLPNVGAWMERVASSARRDVDEGTFLGVVQGEVSPGVRTATQHAMQLGAARMGFEMPMTQLNLVAGELLGMCARMVSLRGESVTIGEVTCSPDDFEGNFDFDVEFMAKDEGQKLRESSDMRENYKMGLLDFEKAQEILGEPDATGMRRRILIDKARGSESIQNVIWEAAIALFRAKISKRQKEAQGQTSSTQAMPGMQQTPMPQPGFIQQPGGTLQDQSVEQGMTRIPGQEMNRVVPR